MTADELDRLVPAAHASPHDILGPHPHDGGVTVRVFRPLGQSVRSSLRRRRHATVEMTTSTRASGSASCRCAEVPDYRLEVDYDGAITVDDPYRYLPTSARSTST